MMISRRGLLAGSAALAAFGGPAQAGPGALADAAAARGLLFGASIGDEAFNDPAYADLYRREARILTTDVALKFDWLRPGRDRFEFERADRIVGQAQKTGKPLRGHTLIWNDRTPDWLRALPGAEVERVFDEHIERVVSRYAGKMHSWDVVNEPFWPMDRQKGGWRNGPWLAAMGPAYVERAFRRARAIDPLAKLTLNEAQCENDHDWGRSIRPPLAGLVEDLLHKGAPLHAVGFQSHIRPQWPHDFEAFAGYASGFGDKGLEVYLTEFDVDDSSFPDDIAARKRACAEAGGSFLAAARRIKGLKMLVTWQLADRYSWYRDVWKAMNPGSARQPAPLAFGDDLQPNPLHAALLSALSA